MVDVDGPVDVLVRHRGGTTRHTMPASPFDLACARAGGVRCLLVGTGHVPLSELEGIGADAVLPDLSDVESVVALLAG